MLLVEELLSELVVELDVLLVVSLDLDEVVEDEELDIDTSAVEEVEVDEEDSSSSTTSTSRSPVGVASPMRLAETSMIAISETSAVNVLTSYNATRSRAFLTASKL